MKTLDLCILKANVKNNLNVTLLECLGYFMYIQLVYM